MKAYHEPAQDKKSDESIDITKRMTLIKQWHIKIKFITSERGVPKVMTITFGTASPRYYSSSLDWFLTDINRNNGLYSFPPSPTFSANTSITNNKKPTISIAPHTVDMEKMKAANPNNAAIA